jgi:hypothetical protein
VGELQRAGPGAAPAERRVMTVEDARGQTRATEVPVPPVEGGEQRLVARLRAGEEAAFAELVDRYHQSLVRLAMGYVPSRAVAEEVVQETWLAVVQGIDRFAGPDVRRSRPGSSAS